MKRTENAHIVNSGERKDYHLFYIRHPKNGNLEFAKSLFGDEAVDVPPRRDGKRIEITIQFRDIDDAKKIYQLMDGLRLK